MQPMYIHAMAAAILLAFHLPCAAQDLQRIEVAGTYAAQRRDDTAGATVVGREQLLRHGDRSLADALRRVPGITVDDNGGKGSEIRLRGLGRGYTSVLLNGAPLPPGFSIDALAPAMIERVEIIGTASSELSAQGIAGTVNIILRRQPSRARSDARLGLDRVQGVLAPSASWQWGGGDGVDWSLNGATAGTAQRLSGATDETALDAGGLVTMRRRGASSEDNRSRSTSLSPRITWKDAGGVVAWQGFVNVTGRDNAYRSGETTAVGPSTAYPDNGSRLVIDGVLLRSETTWQRRLGDGVKAQARVALQHYPRHSDFQFFATSAGMRSPDVRQVRSDIRESTLSVSGKAELAAAPGHQVTAGWDGETTVRSQTRMERDFDLGTATSDRYRGRIARAAVFVQDEWTMSDAWSLSAGLRWEALHTAVTPDGGATVAQRSTMASPLLQALYKAAPGRRWRLALSRTYKTPAMGELVPRRYTVDNGNSQTNPDNQGNPALRPELAWGLDAAVEQDLGNDGLVSASVYRRRIADVNVPLLFEDHGRWVRTPANQGKAQLHGVALEWRAALTPRCGVRANVARNWSSVEAVAGPDNRLARQVPRSAGAGFDYRYSDALAFGADLAWHDGGWARESAYYETDTGAGRKLDVYAAWRFGADTRLRVSGAGLLARDVRSAARYRDAAGARLLAERGGSAAVLRVTFEHRW